MMRIMRNTHLIAMALIAVGAGIALQRRRSDRWSRSGSISGYEYFTIGSGKPLILFHGFGGDPEAMSDKIAPMLNGTMIFPRGKNPGPKWWLRRAADSDQDALAKQMTWVVDDFRPFLEKVNRELGRPILAGHSQGGMMAVLLGSMFPHLTKKVVASAAWLPESLRSKVRAPIVLYHGSDDTVVPYDRTSNWAKGDGIEFHSVSAGHQLAGNLLDEFASGINAALSA